MQQAPSQRDLVAALRVFALACLVQLPLALNPGYYSHDELQWAVHAADGVRVPWLDPGAFQYRPLTFNLWMLLSRALFDTPMLFHAALVAAGAANACLLFAVGRGCGLPARPATVGALAFVLSPYAVYTHGWVGCIADVLWVGCALLLALCVQRTGRPVFAGVTAALLTAVALLAKEAAFAIPPLLALAWWFDARKPGWLVAMLASGAVAALYLGLRIDVLLHAPREGSQYVLSAWHVPLRWLEYQLFPPILPLQEAITTLQRPLPALVAAVLWLGLLAAVWRAGRRRAALFLLGGIAALLPVLPLASAWNHYGYGFAALAAMTIASAWPHASRAGRIAIGGFAVLTVLHGGAVMWRMQQVGRIQSVFSPALAEAVRARVDPGPVVLQVGTGIKPWIVQRLTHDIPRYHGVPIGARVRLAGGGEAADYIVEADGRLRATR
ncbi:MAG TPA: hypothetical protein VLC71_13630 [Thermomonas sp.]|nr:hypothetical protein [Thermomonas sp.]